ncbi:WD40 repeat domain-containing protein [Chloropicon primus]|uniref:WD40 repeat domain-containing protein n=1 Tax=Chloropicon primus TaxID=1764295 RepID=A0A5B8N056_9CHLO|nr:WD40 repeat domain-containing protein [Chloropicon primus]UPR04323.1 WD40 repeat domain-containing protein [Chloropicon primus]|eukprot:QDZ25114.1 WD40 repeat domain-containing protein [Chloropicon primus]
MEFQSEDAEVVTAFGSCFGISPNHGKFVEVIDESKVIFASGTSLAVFDSAINKREYIRSDETWFRVLASAVNEAKTHCAIVVLAGKPSIPKVRRASVIQRRGSVFGPVDTKGATGGDRPASGRENRQTHIPVAIAVADLYTQEVEQQIQLSKSYFFDPTSICFCSYSQDGKVICIGTSEPENKVIVIDPRTGELLFTFNNEHKMIDVKFTVEKRFKQSEIYALMVLSANKLQSYKQEDRRTTFTNSKTIAVNKQGKFTCMSNAIKSEYFGLGSKDGSVGFYSYSSTGKGSSELKRINLSGKTPYCVTVVRNGSYLLCGCNDGTVMVFEDYHSIASSSDGNQDERRRKAKVKGITTDRVGFQYRMKCSVNLVPMGRSPVVKIMLDLSTCTTVAVGAMNQIAAYSTQTILSGKIASSTVENDYGEVSEIQKELSSYTESVNSVCSSHFGTVTSMDVCVSQGLIASCSTDNTVRVWDVDTLDCEVVGHFPSKQDMEDGFNVENQVMTTLGPPEYVAFLPGGYHLAVCHDETLSLFFILHNRLELVHTFPVSHCFKCFVSKGGNLIAAISGNTIEVFQTFPPYAHFATLKGHLGAVSSLCWSNDDLRIASTCVRGSALLWDMNPSYKTKTDRVIRLKQEEYIRKIDSFIDVAIDDVEPTLKERSIVVASFDGSLQFLKGGNVQHRLAAKGLQGDRATVVRFTTVTMHYESNLTKDLRMVDEYFHKQDNRPKVGVMLVGTHTGNILAFTNWRRLQKDSSNTEATLGESVMTSTRRHVFPRSHSESIVSICTMESESTSNKFNTVISCCAGGNICISYMALQEGMEDSFRKDNKSKLFSGAEAVSQFVLVPHTLIKNFDAEIKEFKVRVQELSTEVEYQRERGAKQQRDTLKVFTEKEANLASEYKTKMVDLEQAVEKAEKTADVKVKALSIKQEETLAKIEESFEAKLYRELEISNQLRGEAEETAVKHKHEVNSMKNTLDGKYADLEARMANKVSSMKEAQEALEKAKEESEKMAEHFLIETEDNYDNDLESELMRTAHLEKDLRQKIHDANLEARMHKRSYDQLVEKLEREQKEEHDHVAEKQRMRDQIEDLEKECLKFEDLIKEREQQLVEKEEENEQLVKENNEKEKQIFLHQELQRDMKERFVPIKERLEVVDERILLQDAEVEKQFNKLRGQKVQIDDKDRLIRTLRTELNKEVEKARILSAKLDQKEYQELHRPKERRATVDPRGSRGRSSRPQRPQSSPVYRGSGVKGMARPSVGAPGQPMKNNLIRVSNEEEESKMVHEFQRQRNVMEKQGNSFLRRATYFEEKVNEVSEQRMSENRELLDENIKLRKRLKEAERKIQIHESTALQKSTASKLESHHQDDRASDSGSERPRPKSAMTRRPVSGSLARGSTSRLIKSVSAADKEKINTLMSELKVKNIKTKEQSDEINRLRNMVNTYRDEKVLSARLLRPASAPPKRWK